MRAGADDMMLPGSQKWRAAATRAGPGGGVALQANWCQRVRHFRTPGVAPRPSPHVIVDATRRDRLLIGDALRARIDRAAMPCALSSASGDAVNAIVRRGRNGRWCREQ